ncbi:MAG: hypothetical protein V7727_21045 [Sneathiella sp.]
MTNDDTVLEIRYSRGKNFLGLLGSLSFVAGIFWLLKIDPGDIWGSLVFGIKTHEKGWLFAICILLLGGCIVGYTKFIFDRRIQIRVDKNGLYLRPGLNQTLLWQDIDDIYLTSGFFPFYSKWLPMVSSVNLTVKNPSKYRKTGLTALLSRLNRGYSRSDFQLAPMLFEISRKNLLAALQSAHQKYASTPNKFLKEKQ